MYWTSGRIETVDMRNFELNEEKGNCEEIDSSKLVKDANII